jgi:hypothetical protein
MSYQTRAYDDEHGDPVVILVAEGTHDVSRLVQLLHSGNGEQARLGQAVLRQVRRHNGGRAALQLLAAHGGPDLLFDAVADEVLIRQAIADPGQFCARRGLRSGNPALYETIAAWGARAVLIVLGQAEPELSRPRVRRMVSVELPEPAATL